MIAMDTHAGPPERDYALTGPGSRRAVENGLASAEWYHTEVPRKVMKELMQRSDGPALRDTMIWFALLGIFGVWMALAWGTWWAIIPVFCYTVVYGGSSDSRWHEAGHGTAFKTRWMNDWLYEVACFMVMREPEVWRWSHSRHHTDTIIVGRDPEILGMRPPAIVMLISNIFMLSATWGTIKKVIRHAGGSIDADEQTYIPQSEWPKVIRKARIWIVLHLVPIVLALALGTWWPMFLMGPIPTMLGGWFVLYVGATQHLCLAEDVLDHRLNTRTVYMNPVTRYLYWNMNYHVEHHMFPMVPYHALPRLHDVIKHDLPVPYPNTWAAYKEIIPGLIRQMKDPEFFYRRQLPLTAKSFRPEFHTDDTLPAPAE
jgi:fatty acid desaturase